MFKAAVVLVVTFVLGFSAAAAEIRSAKNPVSEQYIVVLNDSAVRAGNAPGGGPTVGMVASDLAIRYGAERMLHVYENALKGFAVRMPAARAKLLAGDRSVAYVEEDGEVHAIATQSNATWGLDRIDQRSLPLSGTYTYNQTGSGVRAYIVDTGIRLSHTEFGGRAVFGFDAFGGNGSDGNGHGTHVAGTVGGSVYGVAKNVTLVAVRVLDNNGSGTNSGVIAGVDWVTANHVKPAVANMSLGGGASSALDTAVNNSINAGVTYVLASGNDNADACNSSPARVAAAITVNSSTSTDARSSFSNWGSCTDIFAPGSSITSAWYTSNTATSTISGTSMAAPHVAGVAALYLQSNTSATPSTVWAAIRDSSTANAISGVNGSPNLLLYSLLTTTTTYSIAGNAGTSGATVTAGGVSTTSDASGNYTIANLEAGTYTVTPSKTGCTFSPTSQSVTVGPSATGRNFTASCSSGDTALTSGVTLTGQSVAKSAWNYYYIDVPSGATSLTFATTSASADIDIYTRFNAKPTSSTYTCRPYTSSGNETCTATNPSAGRWWLGVYGYAAGTYSVTATVQTAAVTYSIAGSAGTSGATVTAGTKSATSDSSGNYSITGLAAGTYSVTASKTGCTFSPTSISVTVGPNATGKSFTASCGSTGQVERLANGGFETLTASTNSAPDGSWSRTAYSGTSFNTLIANGSAPRTGTDYAYMGVYNSASQTVTSANAVIPAAATSATLTLYVSIVTNETTTTTAYDKLNVQLVDASTGSVLATLGTLSNLNKTGSATTYVLRSYSVTSYKGKTVKVRFAATNDSSYTTSFRIDDVSLKSDG